MSRRSPTAAHPPRDSGSSPRRKYPAQRRARAPPTRRAQRLALYQAAACGAILACWKFALCLSRYRGLSTQTRAPPELAPLRVRQTRRDRLVNGPPYFPAVSKQTIPPSWSAAHRTISATISLFRGYPTSSNRFPRQDVPHTRRGNMSSYSACDWPLAPPSLPTGRLAVQRAKCLFAVQARHSSLSVLPYPAVNRMTAPRGTRRQADYE
jgi:hypothetical protein